jgi:hypothetical protein
LLDLGRKPETISNCWHWVTLKAKLSITIELTTNERKESSFRLFMIASKYQNKLSERYKGFISWERMGDEVVEQGNSNVRIYEER